jgi:hypothetical protein
LTGLSERYRSAAREGARGLAGCEFREVFAVGEMIEYSDPSNSVAGYTRRAAGGRLAGREVAAAMSQAQWAFQVEEYAQ